MSSAPICACAPIPARRRSRSRSMSGLHYYETVGQNWERAAYIKARAVAGDIPAGEDFLRQLAPYIWRKYLDYAAIADIHAMKRQIHAHKGHARIAVEGHNLKLGRGGIREIEFFVQTQQLIAGGRQPDLARQPDARGAGPARRARMDQPAHRRRDGRGLPLPARPRAPSADDRRRADAFAARPSPRNSSNSRISAGYADGAALAAAVRQRLETVQRHYAALFEDVPALSRSGAPGSLVFTGDSDDPATVETLREMGFANPSVGHQHGARLAFRPLSGDAHGPRPRTPHRIPAQAARNAGAHRAARSGAGDLRPLPCRASGRLAAFRHAAQQSRPAWTCSPTSWAPRRALPASSAAARACSTRCSIPASSASCPRPRS